jgi:diguanylate cyclase (GGDEF)-like protein
VESTDTSVYSRTLARLVGGLFVAGVLGVALRVLFLGATVSGGLVMVLLAAGAAGLALLRWPIGGALLSTAVPLLGAPLVAFGMSRGEPQTALFGLPYLVWLVALAGFFQRPAAAVASTAWCLACFAAWSATTPGRDLAHDALAAFMPIGMTAFAGGFLAREIRRSHVTLDTARRDAEELSLRDPLTALANRRAFEAEAQLRATADRLGGILMVDVDLLKNVNDEFGHEAGDIVLKEVALRIAGAIRGADLAARLGGDEFAVLLEGPLTLDGLRRVADAVRGATSAFAARTPAGSVRVTTSLGGALTAPAATPEQQARSARSRADNALYRAKQAGRDRAILDGETRSPSARRGRNRRRPGPKAA